MQISCVSNACAREMQNVPRTRRIVCFHDEFRILSVMILCLEHHAEMPAEIPRLSRGLGCQSRPDLNHSKRIRSSSELRTGTQHNPWGNQSNLCPRLQKQQFLSEIQARCKQPWLKFMHNLVKKNQPPLQVILGAFFQSDWAERELLKELTHPVLRFICMKPTCGWDHVRIDFSTWLKKIRL